MKCILAVVKICSGNFKWQLLILILQSRFFYKYQILTIYWKILKVTTFLKRCFITDIFFNASSVW